MVGRGGGDRTLETLEFSKSHDSSAAIGHCRVGASKGLGNFEAPIAAFCRLGNSLSAWPPTRSLLWDVG